MEIYFYQAECGDAARISYIGTDGLRHHIMIDSGYERTFKHILYQEIESLIKIKEQIDLWVVSHIHDDHIGGIIKYLDAIQIGELKDIVDMWYYNPPRIYNGKTKIVEPQISQANSIFKGDILCHYLDSKDKLLVSEITNELPEKNLFGLKMTILSPNIGKLKSLWEKYSNQKYLTLEKSELESISEAVKAKQNDYLIKIEDFELDIWTEDTSIENGSSISILTEYNDNKILWLADSHPTDIVAALKKVGYSNDNKLECNWVKVAHHGSSGNNSNELYDMVECSNYLMSANGENIHYLPAKETIARILRNKNRPEDLHYTFHFTYDNPTLRKIFEVDGEEVFSKWNFSVEYLRGSKILLVNF